VELESEGAERMVVTMRRQELGRSAVLLDADAGPV
jgi:hypothetical protein